METKEFTEHQYGICRICTAKKGAPTRHDPKALHEYAPEEKK